MTERDAEGQELDLKVIRVMKKMSDILFESLRRDIDGYGLNLETFQILELLYNKGPHPIQQISDTFSIPSGSITYVVDKLEKKGLIERLPIPGDRRKTIVTMTEEGSNYFATIFPKHVHTITDNLSFVTDEEKLELIRLSKKIGLGIKERQDNLIQKKDR
ncbi:MAG: MarR family transcriptional regulator [Paenibacillus sp.]|nr:MarR family transcriptional regulator [Paenibacillus sp.]